MERVANATGMPAFAPLFAAGAETVELRMLVARWNIGHDIAATVLPSPLAPTAQPEAALWVAEFVGARFEGANGTAEERPSYMQGGLTMSCSYGGDEGAYPITVYVEGSNYGLFGREVFGMPKKQARKVGLRKVDSKVSAGIVNGVGHELVSVSGSLAHDAEGGSEGLIPHWFSTQYAVKLIFAADGTGFDVKRMVQIPFVHRDTTTELSGTGRIEFSGTHADPWDMFAPAGPVQLSFGTSQLDVAFGRYLDEEPEIRTFGVPGWK